MIPVNVENEMGMLPESALKSHKIGLKQNRLCGVTRDEHVISDLPPVPPRPKLDRSAALLEIDSKQLYNRFMYYKCTKYELQRKKKHTGVHSVEKGRR